MNDRYLFRGKREDNGEWVYGGIYHQLKDDVKDENLYIIGGSLNDVGCAYQVISETVGQCTGRSDKNKKKIYEGDILKGAWNTILVVYFDNCYLQFRVREVVSGKENDIDYYDNNNRTRIEVIGNVTDNPELLELEVER